MRSFFAVLLLTITLNGHPAAAAETDTARPLIDPEFTVPDLSDRISLLQDRFLALAAHLKAMRERTSRDGVDERLDELFLPEKPQAFADRYRLELRIAATGGKPADWQQLADAYLKDGALDDAAALAYHVYRQSTPEHARARALATMAEARLAKGELRLALNLYNKSVALYPDRQAQRRFEVLIERYDLRLKDIALDVENRLPSACLVFTQALAKTLALPVGDYVEVEPATDIDISAKDNRICLRGLRHGGDYRVRLRPGLAGAEGARLHGSIERRFQVPDRTARVTFSANSYVLARASGDGLPVTTVNLDRVDLKLYRVDDRNLVNPILSGAMDSDLHQSSETYLEQSTGALVWQGSMAVEPKRNEEVTTLISMRELIPEVRPGLYALVGRAPDEDERSRWRKHATQWLVLSDLGLVSFSGVDGLHVLVRSLETAGPVADASLTLVARNNVVLGSAVSDADGLAHFPPGLLRGSGGDQAAFLTAGTAEGDYNFLRLVGPALDLSERGIGGRQAPAGPDAFLYGDRGVYRPGETVYLSALLRDGQARAQGSLPLTVKVERPGGNEAFHRTLGGDDLGGYLFEVPLSPAARPGRWTARAYLDPEEAPVGTLTFQVEDFVPPRLEAELTSDRPWLAPGESADAVLTGKFLYGPPAADLATEARLALLVDPRPFPEFADFRFGLVQEKYRPQRQTIESTRTDRAGETVIRLTLEQLPDTSHPLMAELRASLLDLGGRPVESRLRLPIRAREAEVGLRPRFNERVDRDSEASFDLIALDREGKPVPGRRVAYEWIREIYDYNWYQQNGEWRYRPTVYDEVVATGETMLDENGRGRLAQRLDAGRFRLEVFDPASGSAASHRFSAGWWYDLAAPDVPDALEISLERASLANGETLKAFVRAPFAGTAVMTVMNDGLHHRRSFDLPAEGTEITLPVSADWGPGAYLMVTAFRPGAGQPSPLPTRAMGLAWFSVDREARSLDVTIDVPATAVPRRPVTLPITVEGAAGSGTLSLTLAAVDEGILQLTDFATPDPTDHYLGQRRLTMDLRDLYGRLIRPAEGRSGRLRSGGDRAAMENAQGIALRTVKTVALYKRDIRPDAEGKAEVTLELPDFNGRLRLMAVAYGTTRVGGGDAALTVRDPLIADLLLPRFLAPGDAAEASLDLHNLSGAEVALEISLAAEGAVSIADGATRQLSLADGARRVLPITVLGGEVGDGRLRLRVTGAGLDPIERSWDIAVRPAQPYQTRRLVRYLEPGETASLADVIQDDFLPETAAVHVTLTAGPDFNLPALLDALHRYPYGCTEQSVSRALPLLSYGDLSEQAQGDRDDLDSGRKVDRSIRRVLQRQRGDGSFSAWQSFGPAHPWLSAYVVDFLTRARAAGHDVPPAAYDHGLAWLERFAEQPRGHLYARAYAYYVLARVGRAKASDLRYFAESQASGIRTRLGLGHLAAALAIMGESERAEALYEKAIAKRRPRNAAIYDYGSDLRDGAAIAALLAEGFPGSQRQQRLATALERAFDRRDYFSTQEQAWLVLATHALTQGTGAEYQVAVNDEILESRREALRISLAGADIDAGYSVRNEGDGPLRFIAATRAVPKTPLPQTADGFTLTRTFFTAEGQLTHPESVTQNDRFVVLIEGKAEHDREQHALIVDLLPAGFEIENPALGGEAADGGFAFLPKLSKTEFTAARDDRFVAAVDLKGDNRFAVAYLVRAVTPGRYSLPGSFVEDMYRPRYHARLATSSLTIARP